MATKPAEILTPPDIGRRRIITVVNQKGGSTKTTSTVGLAYAFVQMGLTVRVWDADPQGGSVTHWLTPKSPVGEGLLEVYRRTYTADDVTSVTAFERLYIVPSYKAMREVETRRRPGDEMILKAAVRDSTAPIDVEILDSTHNMNSISLGAVAAADDLLIPLQPSELDLEGMTELLDMIEVAQTHYTPTVKIAAFVIGFANARAIYDQSILADFKEAYPDAIVTYIPMAAKMREAVAAHAPHQVHVKSKKNIVNVQFADLAQAFVDRWIKE